MNHDFGVPGPYFLVETKDCPAEMSAFKRKLDSPDFKSEFIGASEQECKDWLLREEDRDFIDGGIVYIADARSAKDETLLASRYSREPIVFGDEDEDSAKKLPPQAHTWYDFRVRYKDAMQILDHLKYGPPDAAYPVYYERKDEIVDENGVVDAAKADRLVTGQEA